MLTSEREGLQTSNLVHRRSTKTRISYKRRDLQGQGRKVTWCVWQVLSYKSRTKRPRNTKIGRTVAHPTGNNAQQFQGQRRSTKTRIADKRRHQASYSWDRNCIISTEREDLRTSELVHQWSMRCQLSRPALKLLSWVLARGRRHTVSAAPGGHAACLLCIRVRGIEYKSLWMADLAVFIKVQFDWWLVVQASLCVHNERCAMPEV